MSSPSDHNPEQRNNTCYNDKSPPLYPSTDRFNPLGFSTPQQRGNFSSQARNYYSVQPKHMLPRAKGSDGRYRHRQQNTQYQDRSSHFSQDHSHDGAEQGNADFSSGKRLGVGHSWRGYQNKNQRFGGYRSQHNYRQKHQVRAKPESCNIADYFHPSMLEDPWKCFGQNDEYAATSPTYAPSSPSYSPTSPTNNLNRYPIQTTSPSYTPHEDIGKSVEWQLMKK
ncbi:DNA-directed RNA polymerase II subunit RPB1 [Anopheles moucheti]|uniref:DNA-directed RNA polymerase II subunit RPB1 n=1 Tax=Anopheles moucheti TaxID=186751 RepID=UPI0022F10E4A|nr:DNA-directed RNA polymerase II subunit RPB1 [Anopheles moucheti]